MLVSLHSLSGDRSILESSRFLGMATRKVFFWQNQRFWCFCRPPTHIGGSDCQKPRIQVARTWLLKKRRICGKLDDSRTPPNWLPRKGAFVANSTIFVLLWGSRHFDGSDGQRFRKSNVPRNGFWKRSLCVNLDDVGAFTGFLQNPGCQKRLECFVHGD